jgi:hypothetical protein
LCWKPTNCTTEKFSVDSFCQKLRGRSILIVGDSLGYQFYQVLHMQLETPNDPRGQWESIHKFSGYGEICINKGGGKLVYMRNDQIKSGGHDPYKTKLHERPAFRNWLSVAYEYDIIIINKGAHFVDDVNEFIDDTKQTAQVKIFYYIFIIIYLFLIIYINILFNINICRHYFYLQQVYKKMFKLYSELQPWVILLVQRIVFQ